MKVLQVMQVIEIDLQPLILKMQLIDFAIVYFSFNDMFIS